MIPPNINDTDSDKVPDWWELQYGYDPYTWNDHGSLDPDLDGLTNDEECYTSQWGSDPFSKDIFVEIDWMLDPDRSDRFSLKVEGIVNYIGSLFKENGINLKSQCKNKNFTIFFLFPKY